MYALGLFAKRPLPGQVKTRLGAATSLALAAELATAFLLDLTERLAMLDVHRVLAFAPREAEAYFAGVVGERFSLTPQTDGHLGERMSAFFTAQFQAGADRVVLLGTDSPTLPMTFVEQAFAQLEHADVVLGPATDGGYYLVGCRGRVPPIFDQNVWSHSRVLSAAVAGLTEPGWRLSVLPPWYDVDTLDDWYMLQGHLLAMRRAGLDPGVPRTEQLTRQALT